jgi:hypothetical protein
MFLVVLFIRYRRLLVLGGLASGLLCYGLMLGTVVNFLGSLPSIIRFQFVVYMALLAVIFVFTQGFRGRLFPWWAKAPVIVAAALFIIVEIRIGFDTMGIMTIVGNPVVASFVDNDIPLIKLIK